MILKVPESFGVEYSSKDEPQNGKLQIMGAAAGQFSNTDYCPEIKERDFLYFLMMLDTVFILLMVQGIEEHYQLIVM